jgi:hypothetical protein
MFVKMLGVLLTLSFAPSAAMAQQSYVDIEQRLSAEQRHATGLDTLSPAQLELLNRLLREDLPPREVSAQANPVQVANPEQASGERSPASYIGLEDQPIRSRLKGEVGGWEPGTVFALENGQQWKVLKGGMTLHKPLHTPEIVVVPGVMGRWFLQVDEDLPKARVYRID